MRFENDNEQPTTVVDKQKTPCQYFSKDYGEVGIECTFQLNVYFVREKPAHSLKMVEKKSAILHIHTIFAVVKLPRVSHMIETP